MYYIESTDLPLLFVSSWVFFVIIIIYMWISSKQYHVLCPECICRETSRYEKIKTNDIKTFKEELLNPTPILTIFKPMFEQKNIKN
jgi:hypothetical protein